MCFVSNSCRRLPTLTSRPPIPKASLPHIKPEAATHEATEVTYDMGGQRHQQPPIKHMDQELFCRLIPRVMSASSIKLCRQRTWRAEHVHSFFTNSDQNSDQY
jgi:hypothetical protein